jgi:beta-ribofuranosylaminobenzene 5'-phosphate synthase
VSVPVPFFNSLLTPSQRQGETSHSVAVGSGLNDAGRCILHVVINENDGQVEFENENAMTRSPCAFPEREGLNRIHVRAPSRLHFGMFSFGHAEQPQFGGVGVMIEPPAVELQVSPADVFSVVGGHTERVRQFAEKAVRSWKLPSLPNCRIKINAPPDHTGLGVGTQLGLAVAAGVRQHLRLSKLPAVELAASVGRGGRSSVGIYGFEFGGLVVDGGKRGGERVGELVCRLPLPEEWRFVLIRTTDGKGLAGECEARAFAELPPVPRAVTRRLWGITNERMLPAVRAADCAEFGEAVYEFGRLAGECFAAAQRGPFANARIAGLVDDIRDFGVKGVGQSSWGPTVFAILANDAEAKQLVNWLRSAGELEDVETAIAHPNNSGVVINE